MRMDRRAGAWVVGLWLLCASCVSPKEFTPQAPSVPQLRLPRNDVYEGSVITGALRPTFVWEASTHDSGDSLRYELQYGSDSTFATDATTIETNEPTFRPGENLPVSTVPPVGRRYYWRARACLPQICSDYSPTWWVNLGRSAKDFNGDGYADVAVGAPFFDNSRGRVSVYLGRAGAAFDIFVDNQISNPGTRQEFGRRLASSGDYNGDGFADLLVGARGDAYVFFGGPGTPFGNGSYIPFRGDESEDFAAALSFVGDLDGDGRSDVAIGAPLANASAPQAGAVHIYLAGSQGTAANSTIRESSTSLQLGSYLSGADLNGDGYSDLVVTAGGFSDLFQSSPCRAQVYLGSSTPLVETPALAIEEATEADCSIRTAVAGDLNGDGFADLFSALNSLGPKVSIYTGEDDINKPPRQRYPIANANGFSSHLNPVGDINGDGFDDFAISGEYGMAFYLGQEEDANGFVVVPGSRSGLDARFAPAGDVNGDSFDDIIMGGGSAPVFFGAPGGGFDETPEGILSSGLSGDGFGLAVI